MVSVTAVAPVPAVIPVTVMIQAMNTARVFSVREPAVQALIPPILKMTLMIYEALT